MMKNAFVAVLALGAGLVLIPSASADSIGSKAGGSYTAANLKTNANQDGLPVAGDSTAAIHDDAQLKSGKDGEVAVISSNDQSALSNGLGVRREIGAAGSGHFYFASASNSRAKNAIAKGSMNQAASVVALAETPEPESLFLLGTGLLCMALAVFWKSAKRPTES